jgi:signal transduction histidine kinase
VDDAAHRSWVGWWSALTLAGALSVWLGRLLLPTARLIVGLGPLALDPESPRAGCRDAAVGRSAGGTVPEAGDGELVELRRRVEALAARLAERERELAALAGRLVRTEEEVRRRISLDLHDEPLQRAILLHRLIGQTADHPMAARWLAEVEAIAASIRSICNGLRPRVLDDFGLDAGLEWLLDEVRARSDLTAVLATASPDPLPSDRPPADLDLALFRIAQEALNNCLKHARATRVDVILRRESRRVRLIVADDGVGRPEGPGGDRDAIGLAGMRERLRPWGGVVTVSTRAGGGTVVTADVSAGDGVDREG